MTTREASPFCKPAIAGCSLLGTLAFACGGGNGFSGSASPPDAGTPDMSPGDAGLVVVVAPDAGATTPADTPADAGTDVETSLIDMGDARDTRDAMGAVDAMADAGPSCAASELACDGQCVSIDPAHCGTCQTKCGAPDGGTATCTEAGRNYTCGISCDVNLTQCGGSCIDPQSDTSNCGRCGHSCVAGACVAGQCQSWIVTNASVNHAGLLVVRAGTVGHVDIVTDGTNVVWIDAQQGVLQVSATAGQSAPVVNLWPMQASTSTSADGLATANGVVVWTMTDTVNGVSLWKATVGQPMSGEMVASLGAGSVSDVPSGLAIDSTGRTVYFLDTVTSSNASPQSPGLYTCDLPSKLCVHLYDTNAPSSLLMSNDVAFANGILIWTDSAAGNVMRADYTHNAVGIAVSNQLGPTLLATDTAFAYWANVVPASSGTTASFSIARTSLSYPGQVTSLASMSGSLMGMGSDGTNLYFAHNTSTQLGALDYVPADGSAAAKSLKPNQTAYGLAVGGGAIYWLNGDDTIDGIAAP